MPTWDYRVDRPAETGSRRRRPLRKTASFPDATFARSGKPAIVMHREVAALVRLAQGDEKGARRLLDEGVEVAESMGAPRGSATPVKPVHELYGEVLVELGEAEQAVELFESSLRRTPNRPRSLLALARARLAAGDRQAAAQAYSRLASVWEGRDGIEAYLEARRFLESMSGTALRATHDDENAPC